LVEIVVTSFGIKNDGKGKFQQREPPIDNSKSTIGSVAIADLDNDGDFDVLSTSTSDHTIRWHESDAESLNVEKVLPHTAALYPNPTSSEVYLNYATATNTTYGLFDMSGKRLATYTQSGTAHQLDVSSVSKGTYILKATNGLQVNYYRIVKE